MPGTVPSLDEIEATVARMEERYRGHPLFADYVRLKQRFDADLLDARDRALAKSAALMLIKYENDG
jgi:hypothetical protein